MCIFESDFASVEKGGNVYGKMNKKTNLMSEIINGTKKKMKEPLKRLRTVRRKAECTPAVIMEELTHEFKRLWIYKRLHIRIG